jgi:hypothetical protein
MNSVFVLYITVVLMAIVAFACTVLCLAWSIPSWRRRLARSRTEPQAFPALHVGLSGWQARVGNCLISIGIASCALAGWYGCYCVLAALNAWQR